MAKEKNTQATQLPKVTTYENFTIYLKRQYQTLVINILNECKHNIIK